MMARSDVTVSARSFGRQITLNVRVTGLRIFWLRWWIARHLLVLAAWVAGCGLTVDLQKDDHA
jgi:hypothetical protein